MTSLRIYNVWHNKLFSELYDGVSADDMAHVVMFGVNERYTKEYDKSQSWNVQFEWDLDLYNPNLQQHGYCQTTAMYHVYKNDLYNGLDYIGFMQYDMRIKPSAISWLKSQISDVSGIVIFHAETICVSDAFHQAQNFDAVLECYNTHFNTNVTYAEIASFAMPVVHTFVIPVDMFKRMMEWISMIVEYLEHIYPDYISNMSQAELLERCHGLFLAIECLRDPACRMQDMRPYIEHVWPFYHDRTEFKSYKTIT